MDSKFKKEKQNSLMGHRAVDDHRIELTTESDVDSIDLIERKSFLNPWPKSAFYNLLSQPHVSSYVVKQKSNHKLVAYIFFMTFAPDCEILNIAVHPSHLKTGIAKYLLLNSFDIIKKMGCSKIFLEVRKDNLKAINLYTELGFQHIMTRSKYYLDGMDALIMLKTLS